MTEGLVEIAGKEVDRGSGACVSTWLPVIPSMTFTRIARRSGLTLRRFRELSRDPLLSAPLRWQSMSDDL